MRNITLIFASIFFYFLYNVLFQYIYLFSFWIIPVFGIVIAINVIIVFLLSDRQVKLKGYVYIIITNLSIIFISYIVRYGFKIVDIFVLSLAKSIVVILFYVAIFYLEKFVFKEKEISFSTILLTLILNLGIVTIFSFVIICLPIFHTTYFSNGNKRMILMIDSGGLPYGKYEKWDIVGRITERGYYKDGYKIGIWEKYDSTGRVSVRIDKDLVEPKVKYIYK